MVATTIGILFMVGAVIYAFIAWLSTGMRESYQANAWMDAIPHWAVAIIPLALGAAIVWR